MNREDFIDQIYTFYTLKGDRVEFKTTANGDNISIDEYKVYAPPTFIRVYDHSIIFIIYGFSIIEKHNGNIFVRDCRSYDITKTLKKFGDCCSLGVQMENYKKAFNALLAI